MWSSAQWVNSVPLPSPTPGLTSLYCSLNSKSKSKEANYVVFYFIFFKFQIEFEAQRNYEVFGDVAIDDISFRDCSFPGEIQRIVLVEVLNLMESWLLF